MMSILPNLGERGRDNVLEDYITAHRGYRYAKRYFPPEDRAEQPTSEDTIASLENNQLAEGKQVIVSPDNRHAVHAPHHMRLMMDQMKMYQEQGEGNNELLYSTDQMFSAAGPHFTKHLLYLQRDPTRRALVQQLTAQWGIAANFGDMIRNNAQAAREAEMNKLQKQQQEFNQLDKDTQIKQMKVQADSMIKLQKLSNDAERDKKRDQLKYLQSLEKIREDSLVQRIKNEKELALKAQKELADDSTSDRVSE